MAAIDRATPIVRLNNPALSTIDVRATSLFFVLSYSD